MTEWSKWHSFYKRQCKMMTCDNMVFNLFMSIGPYRRKSLPSFQIASFFPLQNTNRSTGVLPPAPLSRLAPDKMWPSKPPHKVVFQMSDGKPTKSPNKMMEVLDGAGDAAQLYSIQSWFKKRLFSQAQRSAIFLRLQEPKMVMRAWANPAPPKPWTVWIYKEL